MSLSSTLSLLGVPRARPTLAVAALAAMLAACGDASTAPTVAAPTASPSLLILSGMKVLRYTETCTGTTCTFDASPSSGYLSFAWTFVDGAPNATVYGKVATRTFPSDGTFPVILKGMYSGGSSQVMKTVICTAGVCF